MAQKRKEPRQSSKSGKLSPKTGNKSLKSKKGSGYDPSLRVVALNPKTMRPYRQPTGKETVYGILDRDKKITPLQMEPQKFTKNEAKHLDSLINLSGIKKATQLPNFLFFEQKTRILKRHKKGDKLHTGKTAKGGEIVMSYDLVDGKKVYKKSYKRKMVFKKPRTRKGKPPAYATVSYLGPKRMSYIDPRITERGELEMKAHELNVIAKEVQVNKGAASQYEKMDFRFAGDTLKEALYSITANVPYKKMASKGVTSFNFEIMLSILHEGAKIEIGPIHSGKQSLYQFEDLPNKLGREIRKELAYHGLTFTKYVTLEKFRQEEIEKATSARGARKMSEKFLKFRDSRGNWIDLVSTVTGTRGGKPPLDEIDGEMYGSVTFRFFKHGTESRPIYDPHEAYDDED